MKAPKDHFIIQIDVTNACVHKCSNCTRFCGHLEKPYFMEFEYFCKAVDTLIDHPGLIGVMGGEPTLHPRFMDMCRYLQEKVGCNYPVDNQIFKYPTDHLVEERLRSQLKQYVIEEYEDGPRAIVKGAGLWTSVTPAFIKYYEIIQDTFNWQNLNDHTGASYHQPILITRKELGISDGEWLKLRDKCWVNQEWSGSVTPKGCFFCEVAGAFDMMYDGPGGLPLEPGWWRRPIEDYEYQFKWCEMCGMPLKTYSRDAREETDDVSEYHIEKLKESSRVKVGKKKTQVIKINDGRISEQTIKSAEKYRGQTYIDDAHNRVAGSSPIYARELYGVMLDDGQCNDAEIESSLLENRKYFDGFAILTMKKRNIPGIDTIQCQPTDVFAKMLESIEYFGKGKYVVIFSPQIVLSDKLERLKRCIINPGTLHFIDYSIKKPGFHNAYISNSPMLQQGICVLVNSYGLSYRKLTELTREDNSLTDCVRNIVSQWDKEKIAEFSDEMNKNIYGNRGWFRKRMQDLYALNRSMMKEYGIYAMARYGIATLKRYGLKLTLDKFKGRIY